MGTARDARPWRIHFFQRHPDDDPDEICPALAFLDAVPAKVAAEIHAVLDAVAEAPPPAFTGGGKWEAMHANMAGFYEIRVQHGPTNYRLSCLLEKSADDLGGPSIVCLEGLAKPRRTAAAAREYRMVKQYGDEFRKRRTVLH